MNEYILTLKVKGDWVSEDFIRTIEMKADSIEDVVEGAWKDFKSALKYIWKNMESSISMEQIPNPLFSVECFRDGEVIDEDIILNLFLQKRITEYNKSKPKFHC